MASPRVSDSLPFYDPSKSSLAYGNRGLPKLNRELYSTDVTVRQQALLLLNDVLHKRENLATAFREGITNSLKTLLSDENGLVRERSSKVLINIAQHSLGRKAFLQLDMITALSKLFSDSLYEVRFNVYSAVEMFSRTIEGARGTVDAGLIPLCVEKLEVEEDPKLKEVLLDILHWCFMLDPIGGLRCNTILICVSLLQHTSLRLRGLAAKLIFDLTVPQEGKKTACSADNCIDRLVDLLRYECPFVRAQATAALMSIGVITEGKHRILNTQCIDTLINLIEDEDSEVRLNTIKVLSLLAESPKGKKELIPALEKLESVSSNDESDIVRRAAYTSISIITWLP